MKNQVEVVLLDDAPYEETLRGFIERLLMAQYKAPEGADVYVKFKIDYDLGNERYVAMKVSYLREKTIGELEQDAKDKKLMERRDYSRFLELQEKFKDGAP